MALIRKESVYNKNKKILNKNNIKSRTLFTIFMKEEGLDFNEDLITEDLINRYLKDHGKNKKIKCDEDKNSGADLKYILTKNAWNEIVYQNKQILKKEGLRKFGVMDFGFNMFMVNKGLSLKKDEITIDLINEYKEYKNTLELNKDNFKQCDKKIKELCGGFISNETFKNKALKFNKSMDELTNIHEKQILKHECKLGLLKLEDIEERLDELLQLDCEKLNKIKNEVNTSNFRTQEDIDKYMKFKHSIDYPKKFNEKTSSIFKNYIFQADELKSQFDIKEKNIRNLIEKSFPSPQLTNAKFNSLIDDCCDTFKNILEIINTLINSSVEYSPKVEKEIQSNIGILKELNNKLDSLNDELLINISETKSEDIRNILDELDLLKDSIKDYD